MKVASDDGDDDDDNDDDIQFDWYHCIISCIISLSFVDSKVRTFDNSCLVLSGDDFLEVRVSNQIVRKIDKMRQIVEDVHFLCYNHHHHYHFFIIIYPSSSSTHHHHHLPIIIIYSSSSSIYIYI